MSSLLLVAAAFVTLVAGCGDEGGDGDTGSDGDAAFVGSWTRASLTVDGSAETFCSAQLDLTTTTWHSNSTGGGAMFCDCDITGTMTVEGSSMIWNTTGVSGQYCGVLAAGDTVTNAWMVAGDTLTLSASNVVETYARIGTAPSDESGGETGAGEGSQSCDRTNTFGQCTDFTGEGWSEADKSTFCTMGVLQTAACDEAGSVGACLIDSGGSKEYLMTFYADGTPPFQAAAAEQNCNNLGGMWMP